MCDRWDIGGLSTAWHPDTGMATIFVYDGYPGGAGITERGYELTAEHLRATRDTIRSCPCETGCPSCVQSPKCGNGNHPLDKAGAIRLLDQLLIDLTTAAPPAPPHEGPAATTGSPRDRSAAPSTPGEAAGAPRDGLAASTPAGADASASTASEGGSAVRRVRRRAGKRGAE
jgi:DEAD/DEAH box helicase domain-containing protein